MRNVICIRQCYNTVFIKYHVSVISNHAQLNINVCIHISDWRGDGYILTEIQQNTYSKKGPIF